MADKEEGEQALEKIAETLNEKVTTNLKAQLDTHLGDLESKIEAFAKESKVTKDDDIAGDDDAIVTMKQLKEVLPKFAQKIAQDTQKLVTSSIEKETMKRSVDGKALNDFPWLNTSAPEFDKDFVAAVDKEMTRKIQNGWSKDDPDLVYDAAAVVKATSNKWNKKTAEDASDRTREYNNNAANFRVHGRAGATNEQASEQTLRFAETLGLSKERFKQIQEKYKTGR